MNRLLATSTIAVSVFVVAGAAQTPVRFTDVTRESGVTFHHVNGASPDKHLVETDVTWPSGRVEVVTGAKVNHIVTIQEGRGIVGQVPFVR